MQRYCIISGLNLQLDLPISFLSQFTSLNREKEKEINIVDKIIRKRDNRLSITYHCMSMGGGQASLNMLCCVNL